MACPDCGAKGAHKAGCKRGAGSDRGRAKGRARARSTGIMKGSGSKECRDCNGTGSRDGQVCGTCDGSGDKK